MSTPTILLSVWGGVTAVLMLVFAVKSSERDDFGSLRREQDRRKAARFFFLSWLWPSVFLIGPLYTLGLLVFRGIPSMWKLAEVPKPKIRRKAIAEGGELSEVEETPGRLSMK